MKLNKKELGFLYMVTKEWIDKSNKKRTLPTGLIETAQSCELKLSVQCKK